MILHFLKLWDLTLLERSFSGAISTTLLENCVFSYHDSGFLHDLGSQVLRPRFLKRGYP